MADRRPSTPLVLLLAAVLAAGLFSVHNLDLGLHARTGQWIVEHGSVPTVNVMSRLHADHPTVDDKWGFQVAAHALFDGLGPDACIAARLLLMLATFGVLWATARRLGAGPWWTLTLLLVAMLAARARFTFRPDLVSLLLTAVTAWAVLARSRDGRGLLWLVALQVVWVNVHGYFVTGPLLVGTVGLARAAAGPGTRAAGRRLLGLAALMASACLLNPAGWRGALHPFAILSDFRAHEAFYQSAITEFRPPFAPDPRGPWDRDAFLVLCLAAAALLLADLLATWRARAAGASGRAADGGADEAFGERLAAAAVALLFGLMAASMRRNMAPFALLAAPLVAAAATRRLPAWPAGRIVPAALCGLLAWGELSDRISVHDGLDRRAGLGLSRLAYPDAGIEFIARELPRASVFTAFSYGSTFTGRRWPEQVAATDGNTHGYPTAYLQEVMAALSGEDPLAFDRLCARDGHDAALVPMAGPLSVRLLGEPGWALVCVGVREAVWVRRAAVDPGWLAARDLLARWRGGGPVELPGTPVGPPLLGIPRAVAPLAELDQALLLMRAGLAEPALSRAREAMRVAPDDPEPKALAGLLLHAAGRLDEARPLLRASLDGGFNRLAPDVRRALGAD